MRLVVLIFTCCFIGSAIAGEDGKESKSVIALGKDFWPCQNDYQAELPKNYHWPRSALLEQAGDWRAVPGVKSLVESVATSSRSKLAVLTIDRFAAAHASNDAERDRLLTTAFVGLHDELNLYREMLLYGIMQGVANARLASDIAADTKNGSASDNKRFRDALRAEEDALDDARFLCRRLVALEERFHSLAGALAQHLSPGRG